MAELSTETFLLLLGAQFKDNLFYCLLLERLNQFIYGWE